MALTHDDYTVAWICALPIEMAAAKLMLETFHPPLSQPQNDHNIYTLGSVSGHHVVIACLPSGVYGTTSAAIVLGQMQLTFPRLQFALMVGVGGGVPGSPNADIRLGDVVVSMPTSGSTGGGVIQYDYGKTLHDGSFRQTGSLNKPPLYLLTAISQMRSEDLIGDISSRIEQLISDVLETKEARVRDRFSRPGEDWLFKSSYHHYRGEDADCSACDRTQLVVREPRKPSKPVIHYGLIASGNQVLKDPVRRDALAYKMGILCFEMEAAGLMDQLPCLVIRGISDYCDSHKHKNWQGYAALTAAAYTKALVDVISSPDRKEPGRREWVPPSPIKLGRIKELLQPSVYPLDAFQSIGKRRIPGTGAWFRNEPLFQAWVENDDGPLLWVSGTPGCGKSFIAQSIITYLREYFPQCDGTQNNRTSVGYFFFRHNEPETRSFHRALRDIAFQIYQNDPSYRDYVHSNCHTTDDIKSMSAAWRVLFMDYFHHASCNVDGHIILVLDGVDEAFEEDCQEFLKLISDIVHEPAKSHLKVLLLGRPDICDDLVEAFEQPVPTIHVNVNKNIGDITTYVGKRIRSTRLMSRIQKAQRPIIEETLIEKAEGMFLWVDLMLTELNGKTRASSMLESLHKAPKGLDAMLSQTLKTFSSRLSEEQAIELNVILRWVACADRPLTLLELEEVLCVELDTDDGRLGLEDALRTQYASLFVLNREDGLTTADLVGGGRRSFDQPQGDSPAENSDSSDGQKPEFNSLKRSTTVVFCHASIRDYLRNPGYGKISAGENSTPVGVDIVQASLTVLNISLEAIPTASVQSAMRDIALFHWVDQMRHLCKYLDRVDQEQKQETIMLLCQIFRCANLQVFYTYTYPTPVIWFINRETMGMIISIFADRECVNGIDDIETQEWIRFCVRNPAQVFVPLGLEVARRWLVGSWNPSFCMLTVLRVVMLLRGEEYSRHTPVVFVDTVLEVARWAQFEENARWHHHVGACLSELTYYDAAIEHLNISVALEPTWRAKRDLADVFAKLNRLKDSLRLLKECNAHYAPLPTELPNSALAMTLDPKRERTRALSEVREKIALLQIQLGNHSRATKWLMKSIELWDFVQVPTAVTLIIRLVASKSSRDERIMQLLKALDYDPWSYNVTVFSLVVMESFMNWYDWDNAQLPLVFAVCAKSCGNLQWLECKYQTLIRENSSQVVNNICLQELLAHLYDKFLNEEGKATLIWKSIIAQRRIPGSRYYEKYRRARNRAVAGYASRLLANTLRRTGNPQALILSELERVCDADIQSLPIVNFLFDGQPGVYMGIWHKINKREQEARKYFRPYILHALLWRNGGEVGKNFQFIQRVIGHLLAMIGDDNDAITLLQLVHSPLDLHDGTSATPEERMAAPWPLVVRDRVWYCHICLRSWGNFVNCNVCRRCKADICEECIASVKLGDPQSNHACDPSHEWLKVPPPPGVPGTYSLTRNGKALSVEEYMEAVERDWM